MILVKPSFSVLSVTPSALSLIEAAGRTCYKSESAVTEESAETFVRMIIARGHESVLEHASATVRIICDRGVSHELVRHRIASFSQESTRYCDYKGGHVCFVIPPWVDVEPGVHPAEDLPILQIGSDVQWWWMMRTAEQGYQYLREQGWKPEQARSVLPNSLKTEVVMTANFREWRHFFALRTAPAAHPQMREIAVPMHAEFDRLFPGVFS